MSSKKINSLIAIIENHIGNHTVYKPNISKATIGWHIDHSLKVINNVIIALQKSDPSTYEKNFSFLGKVFFKLGFFPRGKARAPKNVIPPEVILKEDLLLQLEQAKFNIKAISNLDKNAYFKHPLFGNVNTDKIHRFLALHTNHHLKIMNDIARK